MRGFGFALGYGRRIKSTNAVMPYNHLGKISDNLHSNNKNNWLERRVQSPEMFARHPVMDSSISLE